MRVLGLSALIALILMACDSSPVDTYSPPPPSGDEIVEGINLTELFAEPTASEQAAVRAEWEERDRTRTSRYRFSFVTEVEGTSNEAFRVYVAEDPDTKSALFYGLVRLPARASGDVARRPLVLVLPDDEELVDTARLTSAALPIRSTEREDYVLALLAYRGQTLRVGETNYLASTDASPYDMDVDDALAFADYLRSLGLVILVDENRLGLLGLGRGGSTALLAASRPNPFDLIIDLAGPTDLFLSLFRIRVRTLLRGGTGGSFPAIGVLNEQIVTPLREGSLSLAEARLAMLARSPRYFLSPPPYTIAIHGELDFDVPVEHSRRLDVLIGNELGGLYLEAPEADHETLALDSEVVSLVSSQLSTRLGS